MKIIKNNTEGSAYTFLRDLTKEEVEKKIKEYCNDEELIEGELNKIYPSDKYFVLVDFIDDGNLGYFHIRVWERKNEN